MTEGLKAIELIEDIFSNGITPPYSYRSASIGSSFAALFAG